MSDEAQAPIIEGLEEKPNVTPDTKFRKGGFKSAAELIAEAEGSAAKAAAQDPTIDHDMNEVIKGDETIEFEESEGVTFGSHDAPEEVDEAPAKAAAAETKFKLGGREFATQEEAWSYAEELEREKDAADAFRQGVEAARLATQGNPAPQPQAPPEPQEIDPEYYTNPQAYFAKREAQIVARAAEHVAQAQAKQANEQKIWSDFYNDYPDLVEAKDFVRLTLDQNWGTLQHVEVKQALKQVAEKTRAKLDPIIKARMPKVTLPKGKTAVSPTGVEQVTQGKKEPQVLSFTQQMKNLKKKQAQFR